MNAEELEREVEAVLEEDARRKKAAQCVFNPVSGEGSVGDRFEICHPELVPERQFVPAEMEGLAEVRALMEGRPLTEVFPAPAAAESRLAWFRLRCRYDFPYWAFLTVKVKNKECSDDVPFLLNRPQRKLIGEFEKMRLERLPIRIVLLKARQWGGSTATQMYMMWMQTVITTGCNSLIVAHQNAGTEEILGMAKRMLTEYPVGLLADDPSLVGEKEKPFMGDGLSRSAICVPRRNCRIKVGSAERPDSSRGGDYSLVHLSEVGLWKETLGKKPRDIMRAATSGVLQRPGTMIVMESTANGTGNFFHKEYEAAKRGESSYRAVFVAWHDIENYTAPVADRRAFAERLVRRRGVACADSLREATGAYLWQLWLEGATLENIAWYEQERRGHGDQDSMASEYPSNDIEAFVTSGAHVFSRAKALELKKRCRPPMKTGELVAEGREREAALEGIALEEDPNGRLKVWEAPDRETPVDGRYVVVVDVGGRGPKADWSVVAVFDRVGMTVGGDVAVVAQWRGHCDMDELAWTAARIAKWYDDALLVIESNTLETRDRDRIVDGDQSKFILNQIRDCYPNLYARRQSPEDIRAGVPRKYGFHTNTNTKPMIISNLVKVVRDVAYVERDEDCIDELLTYERRQNGSYGAVQGKHDDLLMTRAIGLHICLNEMGRPVAGAEEKRDRTWDAWRRGAVIESNLFGW